MITKSPHGVRTVALALTLFSGFGALLVFAPPTLAQNPKLQALVAELKQSTATNKQALSHYTWQEEQTTSIKGEVKKQQLFMVRVGPDGQQHKTEINATPEAQPSGGRLKRHVVEKKKAEYQDYGQQIADLARQYTQPDPGRLQQAFAQGNVLLQPGSGGGDVTLIIKNYIKPNDSMKLIFSRQTKSIQSVQISSYLDDPKDAVTIAAHFSKLPDGTNHVTETQINGVSKQLTVVTQNSNYQPT